MKSVTIKRHLRESFKSLKRNGWMSVAAVSAVTVTLLLVGVLLSILLNVNKVATDIENDVQVRVIIDRGTKKSTALKRLNFRARKKNWIMSSVFTVKSSICSKATTILFLTSMS